jgi:hypothetical protein
MYLSGFYPLLFGVSPIALGGLLLTLVFSGTKAFLRKPQTRWTLYALFFMLLYYIATTFNHVAAPVRYQISLYPIACLLAAIGYTSLLGYLATTQLSRYASKIFVVILILFGSIHVYTLNTLKPYYFSYANSLLPSDYVLNLKDMGDGSYQAAQFLNTLPQSENLVIWSDKRGVCTFFSGLCYSNLDHKEYIEGNIEFDYYVISTGRKAQIKNHNRYHMIPFPTYLLRFDYLYDFKEPLQEILPGNRASNYVRIIQAKDIDILCHECLLH